MPSRWRLVGLSIGVVLLLGGAIGAFLGGPEWLIAIAVVGLLLIAFTAPRYRDDGPSGPGWRSAGPSI